MKPGFNKMLSKVAYEARAQQNVMLSKVAYEARAQQK